MSWNPLDWVSDVMEGLTNTIRAAWKGDVGAIISLGAMFVGAPAIGGYVASGAGLTGLSAATINAIGAGTISGATAAARGQNLENVLKSAIVAGGTSYISGTLGKEIASNVRADAIMNGDMSASTADILGKAVGAGASGLLSSSLRVAINGSKDPINDILKGGLTAGVSAGVSATVGNLVKDIPGIGDNAVLSRATQAALSAAIMGGAGTDAFSKSLLESALGYAKTSLKNALKDDSKQLTLAQKNYNDATAQADQYAKNYSKNLSTAQKYQDDAVASVMRDIQPYVDNYNKALGYAKSWGNGNVSENALRAAYTDIWGGSSHDFSIDWVAKSFTAALDIENNAAYQSGYQRLQALQTTPDPLAQTYLKFAESDKAKYERQIAKVIPDAEKALSEAADAYVQTEMRNADTVAKLITDTAVAKETYLQEAGADLSDKDLEGVLNRVRNTGVSAAEAASALYTTTKEFKEGFEAEYGRPPTEEEMKDYSADTDVDTLVDEVYDNSIKRAAGLKSLDAKTIDRLKTEAEAEGIDPIEYADQQYTTADEYKQLAAALGITLTDAELRQTSRFATVDEDTVRKSLEADSRRQNFTPTPEELAPEELEDILNGGDAGATTPEEPAPVDPTAQARALYQQESGKNLTDTLLADYQAAAEAQGVDLLDYVDGRVTTAKERKDIFAEVYGRPPTDAEAAALSTTAMSEASYQLNLQSKYDNQAAQDAYFEQTGNALPKNFVGSYVSDARKAGMPVDEYIDSLFTTKDEYQRMAEELGIPLTDAQLKAFKGGKEADITAMLQKQVPAPTPEEPAPVEPTPEEPTPEEPTPVEPTPEEPTPVEPAPVEPTPEEPAPEDTTEVGAQQPDVPLASDEQIVGTRVGMDGTLRTTIERTNPNDPSQSITYEHVYDPETGDTYYEQGGFGVDEDGNPTSGGTTVSDSKPSWSWETPADTGSGLPDESDPVDELTPEELDDILNGGGTDTPTPEEPTDQGPGTGTPVEPTPEEPTPVEPTPEEPTPEEPTPVEPTPEEPTDQGLGTGTPVEPTPEEPTDQGPGTGMSQDLTDKYNALTDAQKQLAEDLRSTGVNLQQAIDLASQASAEQLGNVQKDLTGAIGDVQSDLDALQQDVTDKYNALTDAQKQLADDLRSTGVNLQQAVDLASQASADQLETVQNDLTGQISDVKNSTAEGLSSLDQKFTSMYNNASADTQAKYDSLTDQQKTLAASLAASTGSLQGAIDQAAQNTTDMFTNLRDTFGGQLQGFQSTVDQRVAELQAQGLTQQQAIAKVTDELTQMRTDFGTQLGSTKDTLSQQIANQGTNLGSMFSNWSTAYQKNADAQKQALQNQIQKQGDQQTLMNTLMMMGLSGGQAAPAAPTQAPLADVQLMDEIFGTNLFSEDPGGISVADAAAGKRNFNDGGSIDDLLQLLRG